MEVCFVDVGQGTANVIVLGGGRAIVIDCGGAQARTVLAVLRKFHIDTIVRLLVSHSHDDHSRGAAAILTAYRGRVNEVWVLHDSRRSESLFSIKLNDELEKKHLLDSQIRLLVRENKPKPVYRDALLSLTLIAPNVPTNFHAIDVNDPNATSAVLILKRGNRQIIFAGDSTIAEWRRVMAERKRPFHCDILTVPHHAGRIWDGGGNRNPSPSQQAHIRSELDWFYSAAVRATLGVVSVGTSNSDRHPRGEVMEALRRASIIPVCTQITSQCAEDLEAQRRRALPLIQPSRSLARRELNVKGRSKNVPCMGTLLVELCGEDLIVRRYADHQRLITRMIDQHGCRPLCREVAADYQPGS